MTGRRPASGCLALAAAGVGLAVLVLAGCTSLGTAVPVATSAPSSSGSVGLRYGDAPAVLTQCGLDSGTIKPQSGQPWCSGGKVLPLPGPGSGHHAAELSTWWDASSGTVIGGQPLPYWQLWAAQHDALPARVCGTSVSASALQAEIAPGQPNPGGS